MNNLENKDILSNEILEAMDILIANCPNIVFGGSIALNAVGLLNRKIKDIDVFFRLNCSLTSNGFIDQCANRGASLMSDTVTNTNGKLIQRTGIKIKNVDVCCFKVEKEELSHSRFSFLGRTISIQNVNYAIQAKIAYKHKNEKHKADLESIDKIFDDYF